MALKKHSMKGMENTPVLHFSIWIPKQKLFNNTSSFPRNTEPTPTSSGVSDDKVNSTSPYLTTFCFSPSFMRTY